MGHPRADVLDSLRTHKFDDIYASYILLGRKSSDVRKINLTLSQTHFNS